MRARFHFRQTAALLLAVGLAFFGTVPGAVAAERIRSFDSDIAIARDGELTVRESIIVNVEGKQIRRGIFRDFPRYQTGEDGARHKVSFDVLSVERDGKAEPYAEEGISGGTRLRIGDGDVLLPLGEHRYVITYHTDRQIRFFDTHDELFWNVTGTDWVFPIDRATATVAAPEGASVSRTVAYTGAYGEQGTDAVGEISADGSRARFRTTAPLDVGEGLTIGVALPKGAVTPPDSAQQREWFLRDHLGSLILAAGTALIALFYVLAWRRVGRDPPGGVIVPRWDVPKDLSPALVTYIVERTGKSQRMTSAALLSLAVKGLIRLEDIASEMLIVPTSRLKGASAAGLPVGEKALARSILSHPDGLKLDRDQGEDVRSMVRGFRSAMLNEHRNSYYHGNAGWVIAGIVLSIVVFVASLIAGGLPAELLPIGGPLVIGAVILSILVARLFRSNGGNIVKRVISFVFAGVFAFGLFSAVAGALFELLSEATLDWSFIVVGALLLINILFFMIMGAPTSIGRRKMDEIEGLKTYIELAEADRMNLQGAPEMSPSHYETLLPYAVALDLEKPWTQKFETWLAAAAAAGGAYAASQWSPSWYSGPGGRHGWSDSISDIGDRMGSAVSSAMPTPSSSSSGFSSGGGFSGGGGGGGGGGGW